MTREEIRQEILAIDKVTKKYTVNKINSIFSLLSNLEGYEDFKEYAVMEWPIARVTIEEWEHEIFVNYPKKGQTLYCFNSLKELADFAIDIVR